MIPSEFRSFRGRRNLHGARFEFTFSPLTITLLELDLRP